jgi:hypothetical protein
MQRESWNIHLTKILICSHTLNGGAYPYMDLNAKYEKHYYDVLLDLTTIDPNKDISKTRQVHVK